jgi:hypothetical protein
MYVQDLKTCTVPNGVWYHPSQAIVLHITDQISGKLKTRLKKTTNLQQTRQAVCLQVPKASQLAHIRREASF